MAEVSVSHSAVYVIGPRACLLLVQDSLRAHPLASDWSDYNVAELGKRDFAIVLCVFQTKPVGASGDELYPEYYPDTFFPGTETFIYRCCVKVNRFSKPKDPAKCAKGELWLFSTAG